MSSSPASARAQWICTTPTKNESWIIDKFVAAASTWANHVIVADQRSTDGTCEQLRQTPSVNLVLNDLPAYDESYRQQLLLNRARLINGPRILIGLDADEAFSANARATSDWQKILNAKPGTILRFRWVNILPGFQKAWIPPAHVPFGFVDDGAEHVGKRIHSPRVPQPLNAPTLDLDEIVVLHFQYVLWERMLSKQRWYQAWEYAKNQKKGPLDIFREYNHMLSGWNKSEIHPVRPEWLAGYEQAGINFRSLTAEPVTWWDREVVQLLREHGPSRFRKIAIWGKDWNKQAARLALNDIDLSDPRSVCEKTVHRLLASTQDIRGNLATRALERVLRVSGW